MTPPMICELDGIETYVPSVDKPWNEKRVLHLYKRMGFGASFAQVQASLAMEPDAVVDMILNEAINMPLTPDPEWAYWTLNDYTDVNTEAPEQITSWYNQTMTDLLSNGFRDRLTMFWSNHLVTRLDTYECPSYMFQYYKLLQTHALGNFKDFVREMGISSAMLVFLNGYQNTSAEPNENYARELYELFTLGEDNGYTQTDIVETARALTGYQGFTDFCGPITFTSLSFDSSDKTIFGQTGNWGYDDVIDILFEQKGDLIAGYICEKLYKRFVSHIPNQEIIDELAVTFQVNDYELAPVFEQMFKSEHFFDDDIIGVQIKSPLEMSVNFMREAGFSWDDDMLLGIWYFGAIMGQQMFDPTDVAGWQGDHEWINSSTLTGRWQTMEYLLYYVLDSWPEELQTLIDTIVVTTTDPAEATQKIVDYFLPNGLQTAAEYEQATDVFKWEVPQNYYDANLWNLTWDTVPVQVAVLLAHIFKIPEFQLS